MYKEEDRKRLLKIAEEIKNSDPRGTSYCLYEVQEKQVVACVMVDLSYKSPGWDTEIYIDCETTLKNDDDILEFLEEEKIEQPEKIWSINYIIDGLENGYGYEWLAERIANDLRYGGAEVCSVLYEWVPVATTFISEASAQRFIDRKGHDYGKLRIYGKSGFWNWDLAFVIKCATGVDILSETRTKENDEI